MKRIGDVMKDISIRPAPPSLAGNITISRRETADCQICQDAGYLRSDVPFGHPMFGRLTTCECKHRQQNEKSTEELQKLSNLEVFGYQTFENFDPDVPGTSQAYEAALEFAREPAHRWLFLSGPCGTGKTHLAVAILEHVKRTQNMSHYIDVVPDLLDHLRATFDPNSGTAYDDRFSMIRNAQVLVLDDLGTENATPWAREKLYQIINYRYMEQLPTVITSNVDQRKVDDRIMSRILDHRLTQHIEMDAEDYRRPGDVRRMRRTGRR